MFNQKQMMKQMQKMQEMLVKMQEDLAQEQVEGIASDGKVVVTMNGHQELQRVKIDPSVVNPDEVDLLEDLIVVAFREASSKAKALYASKMGEVTGGMQIPGLM